MIERIFLVLGVHVSETTDADNEDELSLIIHEVVASSLSLAVHADTLLSESTVLLGVLLSVLVCLDALCLASLLGLSSGSSSSSGKLGHSGLLLLDVFWHLGRRHG